MPALDEPSVPLRDERIAIAALSLGAFVMSLNTSVMGPLLPFVGPELGDPDTAKWLVSSGPLAGAIGAVTMGPVVDRLGRRPLLVWGMALFVVASLAHFVTTGFVDLMVCRVVAGFAVGAVFTAASTAVADVVPYRRRGAAMGAFNAGMYLALPIGMPLAQGMARITDWRMVFVVQGLIGVVSFVAFLRKLPGPDPTTVAGTSASSWTVLRTPMVLPALLSILLHVGCFFTAVQFVAKWLHDAQILPREHQMPIWVVLGVCAAAGSLWLTRYSDRIGKYRFTMFATAATSVALLALARFPTIEALWWVGVPLAIVASARSGPMQAIVSDLVEPRRRGTLMGIRAAFVNLGTGGISLIGGAIYASRNGGVDGYVGLLTFCAFGIAGAYVLLRVWVREPR